jgi:hypothetical protein
MNSLNFKLIRKCTDGINASVDHLITNKYCNHARFIRNLMANGSIDSRCRLDRQNNRSKFEFQFRGKAHSSHSSHAYDVKPCTKS